jgi:glycosyltransferase involved in cell wall biosynthesis
MPEVSVIIPTYNSALFLPAAVESLLAQSFRDFEVLVIDDGSTDDTAAVMGRYGPPVRYLRQSNAGVAAARNRGIAESRGRYVAFLDADDTWFAHKLERQLAALREQPACRVCYSAFLVVDSDLVPLYVNRGGGKETVLEDFLTRGNVVGSICTVVCDRSLLAVTGGFDPSLSQCADWDLWVRLAAYTRFAFVAEPLVTYRQHASSMSRNIPLLEHDSIAVLEKGFAMPGLPAALGARRPQALARNYMVLAGSYFQAGQFRHFLRCAARAVALDIRQLGYLLAFPARRLKAARNGARPTPAGVP